MPPTPLENNVARTKALLGAGARLSDYLSASLLARVVPAEDVHAVLNAHGCNSQRTRSFPAVAGVYYCMALSLYPEAAYEEVFCAVAQGLAWAAGAPQPVRVAKSSISELRSKIGAQPLADLVERCCLPLAEPGQHAGAANITFPISRTALKRLVEHSSRRLQLAEIGQESAPAPIHARQVRVKLCGAIVVGAGSVPHPMLALQFAALQVKRRRVVGRRLDLPREFQNEQVNLAVGAGGGWPDERRDQHREQDQPAQRAGRRCTLGAKDRKLHRTTLIR